MTPAALSLRRIRKSYGAEASEVLSGLELEIPQGQLVGLLGPSGCGKSTLLRIMASLEDIDGGTITVFGVDNPPPSRDRILVLQEDDQLFPWLTALGNAAFPLRTAARPDWRDRAVDLLGQVHLAGSLDSYPHQLSGGMRQRVILARALAAEPRILLLDEPFGALDAQTKRSLHNLVRDLWSEGGLTVVFVSHDITEVLSLAERILIMGHDGALRADLGNPVSGDREFSNPEMARAYGDLRDLIEPPEHGRP